MFKSEPTPLHRFVRYTLIRRLAFMTVLIALGVASVAYLAQSGRLEKQVVEIARQEIDLIVARAKSITVDQVLSTQDAFRKALAERAAFKLERVSGRFVYTRFAGRDPAAALEIVDDDYSLIGPVRAMVAGSAHQRFPEIPWSNWVRLNGQPHIHVVVPVRDREGRIAGEAEGVFAVSAAEVQAMRGMLLRTLAFVVAVVVATSLLLYPVIVRLMHSLSHFAGDLLDANLATITLLGGAIAKRDSDTDAHNYRVTLYSVRFAESLKLPVAEMRSLIKGAFLHDVGKIGIRDQILLKQGKLSDEEFAIMKTHVVQGLEIVSRSRWLEDATQVIGGHHEKVDGSGYPEGRQGDDIPRVARIFAIADVFDALSSQRPYKDALPYEECIRLLNQGRGAHFDAALLDGFIGLAPALYRRYAGREDQGIRDELDAVTRQYFHADAKALQY